MTKLAFVVLALAACRGNKEPSPTLGAKALSDGTSCPIPTTQKDLRGIAQTITARFAVGAVPDYRVNSASGEAAHCHDDFIANDVVKKEGDHWRVVAEGLFGGHCPKEDAKWPRVYEAVKPAKAIVEVMALATGQDGLGRGKPVLLDSATPDKRVGVMARVVDRCGGELEAEASGDVVTWTPAASCEKVAKVVPYEAPVRTPTDAAKGQSMQVMAIGPGTCTIELELLGAKGEVPVTVK